MNTELMLISIFLGGISTGSGFYIEKEYIKDKCKRFLIYFHAFMVVTTLALFSFYVFSNWQEIGKILYLVILLMVAGSICLRVLAKHGVRPMRQSLAMELLILSQQIGALLLIVSGAIVFCMGWLIGLAKLKSFVTSKHYKKIASLYMLF